MNWLVIAVVGVAAAWFEYNYQRSRHSRKKSAGNPPHTSKEPLPDHAHVEQLDEEPSIAPGDENDKRLDTTA